MVLSERMQALGDQARTSQRWRAKENEDEDEDEEAKAAVIHEWDNWAALHTDDLTSPSVGTYFFDHLQEKKIDLLNFPSDNKWQLIHNWLIQSDRIHK